MKIFLLEDDEADSTLINLSLKRSGIKCTLVNAKTLAEANEILNDKEQFDCAILDGRIPDGNGLSLMDRLSHIPCIMLTGMEDEDYSVKAMQKGLEDYLLKSEITPKNLARSIRYAIERNNLKKELLATQKKLEDLVYIDPMTGVMNRRGLTQLLSRLSSRGSIHGVVLVDIDNFKSINDSFGYNAGDKAIQFVSNKLSDALRPMDRVARIGGDEFILIIQNIDITKCKQVAERVRSDIAKDVLVIDDKNLNVTVSIGISTIDYNTTSIEALLKLTQTALKRSKTKGKNAVYV